MKKEAGIKTLTWRPSEDYILFSFLFMAAMAWLVGWDALQDIRRGITPILSLFACFVLAWCSLVYFLMIGDLWPSKQMEIDEEGIYLKHLCKVKILWRDIGFMGMKTRNRVKFVFVCLKDPENYYKQMSKRQVITVKLSRLVGTDFEFLAANWRLDGKAFTAAELFDMLSSYRMKAEQSQVS